MSTHGALVVGDLEGSATISNDENTYRSKLLYFTYYFVCNPRLVHPLGIYPAVVAYSR